MPYRDENGLTPAEERFCQLLARSKTYSEAYRLAFSCTKATHDVVNHRASRLAAKLAVKGRIAAILAAAKIQDLLSDGEHFAQCIADAVAARTAENWTAVAAFDKQISQMKGMNRDTLAVSYEQMTPDHDMAMLLAKGDEAKAAAIRAIMGTPSFEQPQQAQEQPELVQTRH